MRPGARVRLLGSGEIGVVVRVLSVTMVEVAFTSGVKTVSVSDLEAMPGEPTDALLAGDTGSVERWGLRLQAIYLQHAYRYDELTGLSNARIEPQLHQVYVAHRVTSKLAPRMILADEVGLGKTIEAGLVLKELRARQLIGRVLVVCPASLQLQWQHELRSKFNEDFVIMDGAAAKHLGRGGANPFTKADNIICSLTFATMPKRAEQIVEAGLDEKTGWHLAIFDEAHRVRRHHRRGSPEPTRAYELADELKDLVYGLLLLTATPMQLAPYELWSHIELIEPGLYPDYNEYEYLRRSLPSLNAAMGALQGWGALSPVDRAAFLRSDAARTLSKLADVEIDDLAEQLDVEPSREELMDQLVEEHPLSRVLVRNRKVNVGGFTRRKATRIPVEISTAERDLYDAVTDYLRYGYNLARQTRNNAIGFLMVGYHKMLASSPAAIVTSLRKRLTKLRRQRAAIDQLSSRSLSPSKIEELRDQPELSEVIEELEGISLEPEMLDWEIEKLAGLVEELEDADDAKAHSLITTVLDILDKHPDEKILIFTQFLETQRYLRDLLEHFDVRVQVFNGTLTIDEKEEAVRRFRENDSVLVSTEAGGEGRNFQFAHILFNYDLPWNPMKVEQRIGRLDRIGQKRDVLIYNLYRSDTIEERVLDVLDYRIRLFEESVGTLDPILGEIESDLEGLVRAHLDDLDNAIEEWAEKDLAQRLLEARELEHTLGDFVMDRASLREERAKELISDNGPMARAADLRSFVSSTVGHWGGTVIERDGGDVVVTIPPALGRKLKTRMDTHIGVFDPETALRLEDRDFFAFGHGLIDGLVDLPIVDGPVAACAQARPDVPEGLWVEIVYEIVTRGVRHSGRLLRHLVNESGDIRVENLTALPTIGLPAEGLDVPVWADAAIAASRHAAGQALEHERAAAKEKDEEARVERLARAERVFLHSRSQLKSRSDQLRRQIAELEAAGSDKQKKVIPALEGQINASERRLRTLEERYEDEVATLKNIVSDSTLQIVAASVVSRS